VNSNEGRPTFENDVKQQLRAAVLSRIHWCKWTHSNY